MDGRALRIRFVTNYAIAAGLLIGAWLTVDALANLDELFAAARDNSGLARVMAGYYSRRIAEQGGSIGLMIGLGAGVATLVLDRRRPIQARTEGG